MQIERYVQKIKVESKVGIPPQYTSILRGM